MRIRRREMKSIGKYGGIFILLVLLGSYAWAERDGADGVTSEGPGSIRSAVAEIGDAERLGAGERLNRR